MRVLRSQAYYECFVGFRRAIAQRGRDDDELNTILSYALYQCRLAGPTCLLPLAVLCHIIYFHRRYAPLHTTKAGQLGSTPAGHFGHCRTIPDTFSPCFTVNGAFEATTFSMPVVESIFSQCSAADVATSTIPPTATVYARH